MQRPSESSVEALNLAEARRRSTSIDAIQSYSGRVPLEVSWEVLDIMEQPELWASALVCRRWNAYATKKLYGSIELRNRESFMLLVRAMHESLGVKLWLAETRVLVVSDRDFCGDPLEAQRNASSPFLHVLPLVFGHAFARLYTLKIDGGLHPAMHPSFYRSLARFRRLTSLHLSRFYLHNMQDLLRIISAFPLLETLALHDAKFIQSHPLSDVVIKRFASKSPIRLQRLSIDEDTFAVIIDWIERSGVCTCLRDLAIVPSKGGLRMVDTFEPQRTPYLGCRWQSCGILIHNASIGEVRSHLEKTHNVCGPRKRRRRREPTLGIKSLECCWDADDKGHKCGRAYDTVVNLFKHINHVHWHPGPLHFVCWYCNTNFSRADSLRRHEATHCRLLRGSLDDETMEPLTVPPYWESFPTDSHASRFLRFCSDVAGRLGGFLSAARNRQLQRVTISSRADAGPNFNNDKICRVLKELDLRDLHKIMDGPCFEGLVVVQAKWSIGTYEVDPDARDGVIQGFTTLVRELFAPWIRRGLVDLSCEAV
ncbi:uncharacterized protein C8Q71DRAFT_275440 [Rhodofomes roseus]|uniref:C2H2-type domain-containing protein n=1 Tax=Rhodofomes roseus TaxID=34475 RepID=A0ABQ8K4W2_9APHY|nr:uncharacterized protein C8Q71DRAFT_275440 [Rhodofomes roseus]KAH9831978.1 hypothetical protein C8Q71DRAFT_275440 [Rhodofomes roseus]